MSFIGRPDPDEPISDDDALRAGHVTEEAVGVDWGDVGRGAFGVLHTAGKAVLSAYGAGGAATALENAEAGAGLLPDWAKPAPAPAGAPTAASTNVAVSLPDAVVVVNPLGKGVLFQGVQSVALFGGRRFAGNGYQPGQPIGQTFSFGVDAPQRAVVVMRDGRQVSMGANDVKQVLVLGGIEGAPGATLAGELDERVGDWGWDALAAVLTSGGSLIPSAIYHGLKSDPEAKVYVPQPKEDKRRAAAQAKRDAAQARLAAAQGRTAPTVTIAPTPFADLTLNDPNFGSMDMSSIAGDDDFYAVLGADMGSGRIYTDRATVRAVQRALLDYAEGDVPRGWFNPGPIDGILGPKTAAAIAGFNAARGVPLDGSNITDVTLVALGLPPASNFVAGDNEIFDGNVYDLGSVVSDFLEPPIAVEADKTPHYSLIGADLNSVPLKKKIVAKKPVVTTKPVKGRAIKFGVGRGKSPHKRALVRAGKAVQRALMAGQKAAKTAASYNPAKHKTIIPLAAVANTKPTTVLGALATLLGAAPAPTTFAPNRPLTKAQSAAVQKHTAALAKTVRAVADAKAKAARALAVAKDTTAKVKAQAAIVKKLTATAKMPTRIAGDIDIGHGGGHGGHGGHHGGGGRGHYGYGGGGWGITDPLLLVEAVDEDGVVRLLGDDAPDEADFLLDNNTEEDFQLVGDDGEDFQLLGDEGEDFQLVGDFPADGGGFLVEDVYWPEVIGATGDPALDAFNFDGGAGTTDDAGPIGMPVRGQEPQKSILETAYEHVPDDGVTYKGEKGYPAGAFGSYNLFYGNGEGFFYAASEQGVDTGWNVRHNDLGWYYRTKKSDGTWDWHDDFEKKGVDTASRESLARNFGPIVGNPNMELKGLQYATKDDQWFWQSDDAPVWATQEQDQALALLLKETADAEQAAKDADAARLAQEQALQDEAQAQQDAAIALAQQKADAETALAQQRLDQQQAAIDAQVAAQQSKLDLQQQAADQKWDAAQDAIQLVRDQAQAKADAAYLAWAAAHPEEAAAEAAALAAAGEGGGGDGGGGGYAEGGGDAGMSDSSWSDDNYQDPTGPI